MASRKRHPWLCPLSWSWKRGLFCTQIKPDRPRAMRPLQYSSKQCTSPTLIFEGSFHSKSSGVHSLSIQDDGSIASKPHGITLLLFPVVKPCSMVLAISINKLRCHSHMCARQYSLSMDCTALVKLLSLCVIDGSSRNPDSLRATGIGLDLLAGTSTSGSL